MTKSYRKKRKHNTPWKIEGKNTKYKNLHEKLKNHFPDRVWGAPPESSKKKGQRI
jgi:hypothetical protein